MFKRILIDTDLRSYSAGSIFDFEPMWHDDPAVAKTRAGHSISRDDVDESELSLRPFLYLIAEEIVEVKPRLLVAERSAALPFVQFVPGFADNRGNILDVALYGEPNVYFSPIKPVKALVMSRQGITMQNAVLLLAAAGLEITLPNFRFDITRAEEILSAREKLTEERSDYLVAIAKVANEAYERLTKGAYKDAVDWARSEAFVRLKPKTIQLERAMAKLDRGLLQRISFDLFKDGLPAIGSALAAKGLVEAGSKAVEVVLAALCGNLVKNVEMRKHPEAVYAFKLKRALRHVAPQEFAVSPDFESQGPAAASFELKCRFCERISTVPASPLVRCQHCGKSDVLLDKLQLRLGVVKDGE